MAWSCSRCKNIFYMHKFSDHYVLMRSPQPQLSIGHRMRYISTYTVLPPVVYLVPHQSEALRSKGPLWLATSTFNLDNTELPQRPLQRQGKHYLKINNRAVVTILRLSRLVRFLQCLRRARKLDRCAQHWIKYKELKIYSCHHNCKCGDFTLLFLSGRHGIVLKPALHVQRAYFSSFNQWKS